METKLAESSSETIREEVRRRYGATARGETSSCSDGCCSSTSADVLGYSAEESAIAPESANLGLGCGNPLAIASLRGDIKSDWGAYHGCMAGASQVTDLQRMLEASGFENIKIAPKDSSRSFIREWLPGKRVEDYLVSATVEGVKPTTGSETQALHRGTHRTC